MSASLQARQIAFTIMRDPVMARQIKEYVAPSELFSKLELDKHREVVYFPDTPQHHVPSRKDLSHS